MSRIALGGPRRHVILTPAQDEKLVRLAKRTGMTASEHLRRAVDAYFRLIDTAEQRRRASSSQKAS